jgi:uncharacterized protein
MSMETLADDEKRLLLDLARRSIEAAAHHSDLPGLDLADLPERLREKGASFVTLTEADGELRGCIGALEAYQPLAVDVRDHAAAAASEDYRFLPVQPEEVERLHIEISRLTRPQPLEYEGPEDLLRRLRPGVDGVILRDGRQRATFLPQVWEKLPLPDEFLSHLCQKMGGSGSLWRRKKLEVEIYQVEEFHET